MDYPIEFGFTRDGGFSAGIPGTNLATYAYPTSPFARRARHEPERIAREMVAELVQVAPGFVEACGYDRLKQSRASCFPPSVTTTVIRPAPPPPIEARGATVKRVDLFGAVVDTYRTEAELNGFRASQGRML